MLEPTATVPITEMVGDALFDESLKYRYRLWRRWGNGPTCLFVMLNPSTADAMRNDRTVAKCIRYAKSWEFGSLQVCNIFALRSTDPTMLHDSVSAGVDPIGSQNDDAIVTAAHEAEMVVLGWGNHGRLLDRGHAVWRLLVMEGVKPHALHVTNPGHPQHPLYLKEDLWPMPFDMAKATVRL